MEKLNIAELINDCPEGMELDCVMFEKPVKYMGLTNSGTYIKIKTSCDGVFYLTKEGYLHNMADSKCIIFPKGKTTWEGFVPPCQFKDGDVVATTDGSWIGITEGGEKDLFIPTYCVIKSRGTFEAYLGGKEKWPFDRLATEEEKQKLFQAIKDNGYEWNAETKTLDKLIEPSFKVGDIIKSIGSDKYYTIKNIEFDRYILNNDCFLRFNDEHMFELVIEPKFKVGDRIIKNDETYIFNVVLVSSEYYTIQGFGGVYEIPIEEQDGFKLTKNKFDITTLKPFESRVLVRDYNNDKWRASFWGGLIDSKYGFKHDTIRGSYKQCIPYENNEYLLGKRDDCNDYYKTW